MMWSSLLQRWAVISFVALVARVANAADSVGTWLYPDPSTVPTFNYLDTLNASWTSDFSTPWLHLWCGITNGNSSSPVLGELYNKTAPATGSLLFPLNYALEPFNCHFELSRQPAVGRGPPYAMSGTFNVVLESTVKPVTWSQNTGSSSTASTGTNASIDTESTASPTPSTSTSIPRPQASTASTGTNASTDPESTASPTSTPSTSTPVSQASGSSGLSQGTRIGIGVGVALGVLALIASNAATLYWLRRRRNNAKTTTTMPPTDTDGSQLLAKQRQTFASGQMIRSELAADSSVHEKDSAPVATNMDTIGELEAPRYQM